MHGESRRQSPGQVPDKVADTNHEIQRRDYHVAKFHDLCPRQVHDFVGNLSRTLSQSRRNGIWAFPGLFTDF